MRYLGPYRYLTVGDTTVEWNSAMPDGVEVKIDKLAAQQLALSGHRFKELEDARDKVPVVLASDGTPLPTDDQGNVLNVKNAKEAQQAQLEQEAAVMAGGLSDAGPVLVAGATSPAAATR